MRTLFFGTPDIAVPALRALAKTTTLVGVVCQPDRPAGRGLELAEPAVKRAARELGVEVHQPVKVKTGNLHEWILERDVDAAVVLAYGRILPPAVLAAPRKGCLNLHASILPRYRGAAPIQWAIIRGETETGVCLMQMDAGLDTGPVFAERKVPILPEDDAASLTAKLGDLAAKMVEEDLPRALSGSIAAIPQDESRATHAPPLTREHGRIDFASDAVAVVNLVRGLSPRPSATTTLSGKLLKVLSARVASRDEALGEAGVVVRADKGALVVATGRGAVEIVRAQQEGKKAVTGTDLVNGRAIRLGDVLGR